MISKHACSASCPCQQGRDLAMAERVVQQVEDKVLATKVAARFLQGNLDVGRSAFTPTGLKIQRFRESVEVTDMTNAGKRGKKVEQFHVVPGHMASEMKDVALKNLTNDIIHMNFGQALAHVEKVMGQQKQQGIHDGFEVYKKQLRGVDVEPMGTTINITNKFQNGAYLEIETSPHSFRVKDSAVINAPGKAAHGFHQDTSYWPKKKEDGITFYGWAKDNISKLNGINMAQLRQLWDHLGVNYDSH